MALDREKAFKSAERLLKQGRVQPAIEEFRLLAEDSPRDLVMLNRVGDLLAREGATTAAIGYYERIIDQFTKAGFFPKAIAIVKKILKLDPGRIEAFERLGDLYLKQRLPGEARAHLLHAADLFLRARLFSKARAVYEKLAYAEPGDPLHRIRLAEARAAGGDPRGAGAELIAVAASLATAGRAREAEKTYRRALELVPDRSEPYSGVAAVLAAQGRASEGVAFLEDAARSAHVSASVAGDLILLYEQAGRGEDAARMLQGTTGENVTDDILERVARFHLDRGRPEIIWERFDPLVRRWMGLRSFGRVLPLLERLSHLEEGGHLPALQRLLSAHKAQGDRPGTVRCLERVMQVYRERSMAEEASLALHELRALEPSLAREHEGDASQRSTPPSSPPPPSAQPAPQRVDDTPADLPVEVEAPAVPLNSIEEEFVNGHLTEAEVFQKYGLMEESLKQLRALAQRFPGHVVGLERLADLLRSRGEREELGEVLAKLAFARRACGRVEEARAAAREAVKQTPLARKTRALLETLSLIEGLPRSTPDRIETPLPQSPIASASAKIEPARKKTRSRSAAPVEPRSAKRVPATPEPEVEGDLEIVFQEEPELALDRPSTTPAPISNLASSTPVSSTRVPPRDLLDEISFYLDQGMADEATHKIADLRSLGYGGAELEALHERSTRSTAIESEEPEIMVEDVGHEPQELGARAARLDEDDLSTFAHALEADLGPLPEPAVPTAFDEQSLSEVFDAFKRHVEAEVGPEDFRTHYDLGIAYKEMGLLDDALAEFRIAMGAPDLFREACSMIALCHRERDEVYEAIKWYRQALEAPGGDDESLRGLRYELAEMLVLTGDATEALSLFQNVLDADPSYRDVRSRVLELEARMRG